MELISEDKPTNAQLALILAPGNSFFEACPGAGKTRAIVNRFARRVQQEPRKGIALLSFTNAAVDEVKARCSSRAEVLQPPNFVGTFDSFINRFITTPLYLRDNDEAPRFVDAWKGVPAAAVRCQDLDLGPEFKLDWFEFSEGGAQLEVSRISGKWRNSLLKHAQSCSSEIERKAARYHDGLTKGGVFSCAASRRYASRGIRDPKIRAMMGRLLANRFAEVIVDEAQDCGQEELKILSLLRSYGIHLVMVADMDQSIYEFRRALPQDVLNFAAALRRGVSLDGNFRSSAAICKMNQSLRYTDAVDHPVGRHKDIPHAVQVVPYDDISKVEGILRDSFEHHGIASSDCVVLAHKKSDARIASGGNADDEVGQSIVAQVAMASIRIRSTAAGPAVRKDAIESVERMMLKAIAADSRVKTIDACCEAVGLQRRWLRDKAMRWMFCANPSELAAGDYSKALRSFIERLVWPVPVDLQNLGSIMKAVASAKWATLHEANRTDGLPWSSIHGVKGKEFNGVAVVLPERLTTSVNGDTVLDFWENDAEAEPRRVLYVGASRARELLILAVHEKHVDRVEAILNRDAVPYELWVVRHG